MKHFRAAPSSMAHSDPGCVEQRERHARRVHERWVVRAFEESLQAFIFILVPQAGALVSRHQTIWLPHYFGREEARSHLERSRGAPVRLQRRSVNVRQNGEELSCAHWHLR